MNLIARSFEKDAAGNVLPARETARTVYADILSVGYREFYDAARAGLKPEIKVVVHAEDYQGEQIAEVAGKRYEVVRNYCAGERTELYLGVKAGAKKSID